MSKKIFILLCLLLIGLCLFSCSGTNRENGETSQESISDHLVENDLIQRDEILPNETIFFECKIPTTSYHLVLCNSDEGEYSIYVTESYLSNEDRSYTKLDFAVPEEIE